MSILTDASLIITPNAYKEGSLLAVVPSNGNGDLTWTRNSGATKVNSAGLIENVLANVPRLDYSLGGCPSILLEPQRTNLLLRSEEFENASWGKTGTSVTANTTISPSGLMNADTLIGDGILGLHRVVQLGNSTNGVTYTHSIYAKKNTNNFIQLIGAGSIYTNATTYANFDLNLGVVGSVGVGTTATITSAGNGWYRCIMTATATATVTENYIFINLITSETSPRAEQNTLTTSVYLYGAQLEQGAYPTSYIPTTSATVTRVADVGSVLTAPLALASITTTFSDNTTNVITTIPSIYQLPLGRIKTIVGL